MDAKVISISMPADLIKKIDEAALDNYESRSDFIRMSIVLRLKGQSIVDLLDMVPEDAEAAEFLKNLKKRY